MYKRQLEFPPQHLTVPLLNSAHVWLLPTSIFAGITASDATIVAFMVPPVVQDRESCAVFVPEEVVFARTVTVQVPPVFKSLVAHVSEVISN